MNTKLKATKKAAATKIQAIKSGNGHAPLHPSGVYKELPLYQIDFSPFNYRKIFDKKDLENFAGELKQHGIISPVMVRQIPSGNYELVAGERRLRAASMAGIAMIPAIVKNLTDEEVIEIQLAENLQRENPHPMHEAQGIGRMQQAGKSIEEIAGRLGKSKQFVYNRIRLLALIEPFREMFFSDKMNVQQALAVAGIAASSQQDFFDAHCAGWKEDTDFDLDNYEYALNRFTYDLKEAPFNIKDKKLIPSIGACTGCAFNTATLKTLFPEYAKEATCTNKDCYQNKCAASFSIGFTNAFIEHNPEAFIFNGQPSTLIKEVIEKTAGAAELPVFDWDDVTIIHQPEEPVLDDYVSDEDTEEEEDLSGFDEKAYKDALEEYEEEMGQYKLLLQNGKLQTGLYVTESQFGMVYFNLEKNVNRDRSKSVTAKDVQAAVKAGTATKELLEAEMERLHTKERRSKQLDLEKIHLVVHERFSSGIESLSKVTSLTNADQVAARLLIYQSLNYYARTKIDAVLFSSAEKEQTYDAQDRFAMFAGLTDIQYSYLIRNAMACQADSKFPFNLTGYFLYKQAIDAGLNVVEIENRQDQKANAREARLLERITVLQKQIDKLKTTAQ